ncbi:hypothetical protein TRVA0_053S00760 [Trichomonascus vanleenenianus]|uniref:ubiquitin-specific protease YUH1 n=1 Tax=Trichomonascus vanleenenianus TaxID=2268995 RepID=UPI003ECA2D10
MSGSWSTIESDAGVFTELIEKLGVKGVEFEELLSIDEDSMAQVQPLLGAIFLFKYRQSQYKQIAEQNGPLDGNYAADEAVFFAHQKIQNACATQAVLSLLLNRPDIELGKTLEEFKSFSETFDPDLKGEVISNSEQIRVVHNSFHRPSPFADDEEERPEVDENDDGLYHFIAYVPVDGVLYELDGLHPHPISHGECKLEEFSTRLPQVLRQRIEKSPQGETRFNLIALTNDKRDFYKSIGDEESLARENAKREAWKRENLLRRESFVGLIRDLLVKYSQTKSDEQWKKAIEDAREATKARMARR